MRKRRERRVLGSAAAAHEQFRHGHGRLELQLPLLSLRAVVLGVLAADTGALRSASHAVRVAIAVLFETKALDALALLLLRRLVLHCDGPLQHPRPSAHNLLRVLHAVKASLTPASCAAGRRTRKAEAVELQTAALLACAPRRGRRCRRRRLQARDPAFVRHDTLP